ncbi:MAG: hypothetical protein ACLQIB_16470 [Isosphaeraceae bacterium]|jgi:hypothetical protein
MQRSIRNMYQFIVMITTNSWNGRGNNGKLPLEDQNHHSVL